MDRRGFLRRAGIGLAGAGLSILSPLTGLVSSSAGGRTRRHVAKTMGTLARLTLVDHEDTSSELILSQGIHELEVVDRLMSIHRFDSDLARVNRFPGEMIEVDPQTLVVAETAIQLAELTQGALDPTVLPLMRYWGFMDEEGKVPQGRELGRCLERVDYHQLHVSNGKIGLGVDGAELDFGGIAKGYGVDQAAKALRRSCPVGALVEAGGDIYVSGRPSQGRRWQIGIQDPFRAGKVIAVLELENQAIATSGTYENIREIRGRRVCHLIDPRIGEPVSEVVSSTIVATTTMEADALSTATAILGVEAGMELVESLPGVEGFWVTRDRSRWVTPGLVSQVRWL